MDKFKIAEFFNREYDGPKKAIIFMSIVCGLAFTMLVYLVTVLAANMATDQATQPEFRHLLMFLVICVIIAYSKSYMLRQTTIMAESTVSKVRIRLIDKLRRTELQFIEKMDQGDIYARITQDTDLISITASEVIYVFDSVFSAVGLFILTAFISMTAFGFTVFLVALLSLAFFLNYRQVREKLNQARRKEGEFFDALDATLSGFKQIKINTKKNDALYRDIDTLSRQTESYRIDADFSNNRNVVLAFILYEGLLCAVAFLVPIFGDVGNDTVMQLVAVMLFVFGMLNGISRGMPVLITTNVAVENLERMEQAIDDFGAVNGVEQPEPKRDFERIGLENVMFQYTGNRGEPLFTVGPVNLTFERKEVVFIVGGNGSGKSTLLKLLTGLYYPMADGKVTLDGDPVDSDNYQAYRELFSIIFTDFHLFRKLYGLGSVDEQRVKDLLRLMDIDDKTDFEDGRFTRLDLSTGQRKRLAYITALLDDKPVYVFDEWAADQDPEYRRYFYEKFIDDLRAAEKTIIAVTHDDKYFHKADRVIKMEEGQIVDIQSGDSGIKAF